MTDLVSLLFIAMIPIDYKITNFPYTCSFKMFKRCVVVTLRVIFGSESRLTDTTRSELGIV